MINVKIRVAEVTEENWLEAAALSVEDVQKRFVAPAQGIPARAYVCRNCGGKVYVISEQELTDLLPEGAIRILVSADIGTIKERFRERMHGNLPDPVAKMLERKHGSFDSGNYDYRFDGARGDADALCEIIKERV